MCTASQLATTAWWEAIGVRIDLRCYNLKHKDCQGCAVSFRNYLWFCHRWVRGMFGPLQRPVDPTPPFQRCMLCLVFPARGTFHKWLYWQRYPFLLKTAHSEGKPSLFLAQWLKPELGQSPSSTRARSSLAIHSPRSLLNSACLRLVLFNRRHKQAARVV